MPEVQIAAMFSEPNGPDAAAGLRQALRRQKDFRSFMSWARDAYGRGQVAKTIAGLQGWQADADDLARDDRQRSATLINRNAAWLTRLETTFAEPGLHFVAFGAGHLLGDDGIVTLLRRRGWTVSPCPGNTCPAISSDS